MKYRLKIVSILLILIGLILACGDDDLDPLVDYRCVVTASSVSKTLFANNPTPVVLNIQKNESEVGTYDFSYSVISGEGDLLIDNNVITPGEKFPVEIDKIIVSYIPTSLGEHKLKFRFQNEAYFTETVYTANVDGLVFVAKALNLPKKLLIDKPIAFDLNISQKEESETEEFKAQLKVLKGKGYARFMDTNDTLSLQAAQTRNIDTRAASVYRVKIGNNKLNYLSSENGENIILLQIENEYGYQQDVNVPLNIELPEFAVNLTTDTIASVGTVNNFLLNIEDTDNFGDNIYTVTYRNLKNSGILKINNNELAVGSTLQLQKGDNVCEFIPNGLGNAALEFIVKDKYNTTQKDTAEFFIGRSYVDIELSGNDSLANVFDTKNFSFSVNKKNYNGNYYFSIEQLPASSASMKVNGAEYLGGRSLIANKYNTLVSFIPQHIGNILFKIKVWDDYESETSKEVNFKVSNTNGTLSVSNHNPIVNLFTSTFFNFSISKPNYSGTYQYEISQGNGMITSGNFGTIKVNGKDYPGGRTEVTNSNNTTVTFIPNKVGDVTLHLKVYDSFGGELSEELNYSVSNTDLKISTTGIAKDILLGKETSFDFTVTKPFYKGQLTCQIIAEPGFCGIIKINNNSYLSGLQYIKSDEPVKVSFSPTIQGPVKLTLKVMDEHGGEAKYPVSFNVTNPSIKIETFNFVSNSVINTENISNFTVSKEHYSEDFKYSITTQPADAGIIKINDQTYTGGNVALTKHENAKLSFFPKVTGDVSLKLTVLDNTGGKAVREFNYKAENPQLQLSIGMIEDDLTLNKKTTFNFSVSKQNYTGKYYYEITGENFAELKVGNVLCTPGQHYEVPNAQSTGVSFIPTKVGRDTVKLILKVTDDWGGVSERKLYFSVTNSDLELELANVESMLFVGRESKFNFTATKPGYAGNLKYEIRVSPSGYGTLKVGGEDYLSGQHEVAAGTPVPVAFTPLKEGTVNVKVIVTDSWSGEKNKSFNYTINSTPIAIEIADHNSEATVNSESICSMSLSKLYYNGNYNYSITTNPENSGIIKVNDIVYNGGRLQVVNPKNTKLSFTPNQTGTIVYQVNITDEIGGQQSKALNFKVENNPIELIVNNQAVGLTINEETGFNFALQKKGYKGKFQFEILQEPVIAGTFKVNGKDYAGGRIDVIELTNTRVNFTPKVLGDVKLFVKAYDEFGGSTSKELTFSVANSNFKVVVSNQEGNIYHSETTKFNFGVLKPNYSGAYQYEIIQNPENAGTLKVNGTAYNGGKTTLTRPTLSDVEYTSISSGQNTLTLKVYDELGGSAQENVTFSCINSPITLPVNNNESNIIYNTPTVFNASIIKEHYNGDFQYEIIQFPANSGNLIVDGVEYKGGIGQVTNPKNLQVSFTSLTEGRVSLKLRIIDKIGSEANKTIDFNVSNPELKLSITNHRPDAIVNAISTFNFAVSKQNYTGSFKYQIEQVPAMMGLIKVNGSDYTGALTQLPTNTGNTVAFTPSNVGAVTLKVTVKDDWGKSSTQIVTYSVSNTDIAVNITNKELDIVLNKPSALNFTVSKPNYAGGFKAKIVQEPAESGSVKMNSSVFSGSTPVNISASNTLEFTPSKVGGVLLKLVVSDDLGGEKEIALNFNVSNPELKLDVTNHVTDLAVNASGTFNFTVSKANYSGGFKFQIVQEPAGRGGVQLNGQPYDGTKITLAKTSNTIIFTPTSPGGITLNLTVEDDWGMTKTVPVTFSVSNTDITVNVTNKEFDLLLNKESSLNFTVSKPNYTGPFSAEIVKEPTDAGTLKLNTSAYVSGNVVVLANNTLSFTPTKTGSALLKLIVSDNLGGTREVPLNFNIQNPEIILAVSNKEANLVYKKPTSFNVAISKQSYSGNYNYEILQEPAASGALTVGGKAYSGGIQSVINPNNLQIGYTPEKEGYVTLRVRVTDNTGSEAEKNVGFNVVNAPVVLTLNTPADKSISIGQSASFTMKADKEGYTGQYNYEVTPTPVDFGTVTVAGKTNLTGTLNPNPSTISFTPAKTGTVIFNVKVSDADGKYAEKQVAFSVENTPLAINFSNNEENIVLNNPTNFIFKVAKDNYPDSKLITYTVSPAYAGTLTVDGKAYTGTSISLPYSRFKSGIPVQYSPDREGTRGLTFTAQDEFGGITTKNISFNVSNPELALYLTGVNTSAPNEATLGSTYKFYYNVSKANYNDDFSYWITLDPAAVGIVGTSDITPRSRAARSSGGVQMETGTIRNNQNGVTTGEIRFTPSNADYLNQEVKVNVTIRDKWNNEKTQEVKFRIVTSAIQINVNRKTSIDVETPYTFYFTVSKPGYTGGFKYSIVGWADGDKIEMSANNSSWTNYAGGKFEVPSADHTYVRYTPATIGTVPMRLFIYDDINGEAMQELTFDVKAPEVVLNSDAAVKSGYLEQFIPFKVTATEGKNENVNLSFATNEAGFNGDLRFNGNSVTTSSSRLRSAPSQIPVESGKENTLEMKSYNTGTWGVTTTGTNRWNKSASVTTSVNVSSQPNYTLTTSNSGAGTVTSFPEPTSTGYKSGSTVTLTATPVSGWKFVRWEGDASGTNSTTTVTMNSNKNVVAVFEEDTLEVTGVLSPNYGGNSNYCKGKIEIIVNGEVVKIKEQNTWTNNSVIVFTQLPSNTNFTVKYSFYVSRDGSNAVTSGSIKMNGAPEFVIPIGSGGLIQYERSEITSQNSTNEIGIIVNKIRD